LLPESARKAALSEIMNEQIVLAAGSVLVLFSAFCFVAAVWRELFPRPTAPPPDMRRLPPPFLIVTNGFLALVSAGIWIVRTPGH
jgi:inner membrane protein YidH